MKNTSFIVITYDPSFNAFLMLTIDLFLTIVSPPLGLPPPPASFFSRRGQGVGDPSGRRFCGDLAAGRAWGQVGRIRGAGSLLGRPTITAYLKTVGRICTWNFLS